MNLTDARPNQPRPNLQKVALGIAQRGGTCVHRVGNDHKIILVRGGRADNKFSIGWGLELNRLIRRLERYQVAGPQLVGKRYDSRWDGGPKDGMALCGRLSPQAKS